MMKVLPIFKAIHSPIKIDEENFGNMKILTTFVSLSE